LPGRSRPCCRIPTFTVGNPNDAVSIIPLLEFPTKTSTCRSRLQYVNASRFTNTRPSPRVARKLLVRSINARLPASALG
jgi:hypothetical protein